MQDRSPWALSSDLSFEQDDLFATVELKRAGGTTVAHWLVSGLTADGLPAILLSLAVSLKSFTESEAIEEARSMATKFILPFASALPRTAGIGERLEPLTSERRRALFQEHMKYHFQDGRSGALTLQLQTECLFRMASYLQISSPVKDIAEFQGVASSTVQQRLKYARAKGRIPKASDGRARHAKEES